MGGGRNFSQGSMPPTPLLYTIVSPSLYEHSPKKILTTLPGPGIYTVQFFKFNIVLFLGAPTLLLPPTPTHAEEQEPSCHWQELNHVQVLLSLSFYSISLLFTVELTLVIAVSICFHNKIVILLLFTN